MRTMAAAGRRGPWGPSELDATALATVNARCEREVAATARREEVA